MPALPDIMLKIMSATKNDFTNNWKTEDTPK